MCWQSARERNGTCIHEGSSQDRSSQTALLIHWNCQRKHGMISFYFSLWMRKPGVYFCAIYGTWTDHFATNGQKWFKPLIRFLQISFGSDVLVLHAVCFMLCVARVCTWPCPFLWGSLALLAGNLLRRIKGWVLLHVLLSVEVFAVNHSGEWVHRRDGNYTSHILLTCVVEIFLLAWHCSQGSRVSGPLAWNRRKGHGQGQAPRPPELCTIQLPLARVNSTQSYFGACSSDWSNSHVVLCFVPDKSMHAYALTSRASIFESGTHFNQEWPGSTYGLIGSNAGDSQLLQDARADQSFRPGCPTQEIHAENEQPSCPKCHYYQWPSTDFFNLPIYLFLSEHWVSFIL